MVTRKHFRPMGFRCYIDVSAFLSVMIALLSMFIADSIPHAHDRPSVTLPETEHETPMSRAQRFDALTVAVRRDGTIYFDFTRVSPAELMVDIKTRVGQGVERKVYLRID